MRETRFKQTEIGEIPEDWEVRKLVEIATTSSGGTPSRGNNAFYSGTIKWFTTSELRDCLLYDSLEHISEDAIKQSSAKVFPSNTLLMAMYGATIGKLGILKCEAATNQACCAIFPFIVDVDYLYYALLKNRDGIVSLGSGAGQPNISQNIVKNLDILIPTYKEQERIAEALSDVDGLLRELDGVIAKKRAIKQGAMQELLTGKRRLEGFVGEWEEKKLIDCFDFYKGNGLSKEAIKVDGKNKCILYGEIFTKYDTSVKTCYSKTDHQEGLPSRNGDILMPGSTTTNGLDLVKAVCVHEENVLLGGDIIVLRPKVNYLNSYFMSALISNIQRNKIAEMTQGITIIHLHGKDLVDISYKIPVDKIEQTVIANILSDMDEEIAELEAKRAKYEQVKQGMMQELLTGKIRLI